VPALRHGEEAAVPSSMIFASLVVLWLLILVPAVARRRQEVARPSVAALSGRVLERPRQRRDPELDRDPETGRELEVDVRDDAAHAGTYRRGEDRDEDWTTEPVPDERPWERPPPRYRPGRGGFDPEAAELTARARYAFRQRVVLALLLVALVTGVIAGFAVPGMWWPHAAVDLALVGYLVYLRRQVRLEESIRERRAARMAGTRRPPAADDPELDDWARRGRDVGHRGPGAASDGRARDEDADDFDEPAGEPGDFDDPDDLDDDASAADRTAERPRRVRGTGESLRGEPLRDPIEREPALPRLRPAPPPPLPAGTALVEADEDDPEMHGFDVPARRDYRRAAGE
jgi:hypothetical protein